jgi:hypothetical protein
MTNLMVNLCKLTILGVVTLLFINFQLYGDVNSSSNVFDISRFSFYSKICLALFTAPLI